MNNTTKNPFKHLLLLILIPFLQWSCSPEPEAILETKVDQTQEVVQSKSDKKVFAHYMVCCPVAGGDVTVEDFKKEIKAAQSRGIDGFALNCGGWQQSEPHYKARAVQMYEAAKQLGTGFQLFISVDGAAFREVPDIINSFRDHPNQFRHNGKQVVSTFGGEGDDNTDGKKLIDQVHSMGAILVPYFYPKPDITELPRESHASQLLNTFPNLDGYFYFGAAGTGEQISESIAIMAKAFTGAGKIFMAGISPYYRGNGGNFRLYETRGFEGMAQEWEAAINNGANWVELVTWNDWNESSYLAPFGSAANTQLWGGHFGPKMLSHVAYLDASRYYINWFKKGSRPAIKRDKLYYFYRLHPKSQSITVNAQGDETKSRPGGANSLSDEIFVTVFLSKPAKLVITTGSVKREFDLAAGVQHVSMPFSTGKQHFALYRGTQLLISKFGEHDISANNTDSRFNYFSGGAAAPVQKN